MNLSRSLRLFTIGLVHFLSGCDEDRSNQVVAENIVHVSATTVAMSKISAFDMYPARVLALKSAQIRPQVGGIVKETLFEQGSEVKLNQPLFQIDPAMYNAALNNAEASLNKAKAVVNQASSRAKRIQALISSGAISRQDYDDAMAGLAQAKADVQLAEANVETKRLDLSFATIRSPIAGRVDQNLITAGALVSAGESNPLATVQQIDQVYVDARIPQNQLEKLRSALNSDGFKKTNVVDVFSGEDEKIAEGQLLFSGTSVDSQTGDVIVRIKVDNKDRKLLPGSYVLAKLPRLFMDRAIVLPQKAVQKDGEHQFVWKIIQGVVKQAPVQVAGVVDNSYVISMGIEPGEYIVTEGFEKISEGSAVSVSE